MKGINIALYFDPDQIQACVHEQDDSYVTKNSSMTMA